MEDRAVYCLGCFQKLRPDEMVCPKCGLRIGAAEPLSFALPRGTKLNDGKYLVGRVLGQGGFGITYVGMDLALELKVAIKECFPMSLATRAADDTTLTWHSTVSDPKAYRDVFVKEARKIAKMDQISGIVQVKDIFYQNGSAYIVMSFIDGETLKAALERTGPVDWETCMRLLRPVIESLIKVHSRGLIHRDISPDNIMIDPEGAVWLLDLGAAKDLNAVSPNVNVSQSSRMVVKRGFSPPEQYSDTGRIGTWTDVYSMCATIYYCLTGTTVPDAMDRVMQEKDPLTFPEAVPSDVAEVLRWGLAIRSENRIQDVSTLLEALEHPQSFAAAPAGERTEEKVEPGPDAGTETVGKMGDIGQTEFSTSVGAEAEGSLEDIARTEFSPSAQAEAEGGMEDIARTEFSPLAGAESGSGGMAGISRTEFSPLAGAEKQADNDRGRSSRRGTLGRWNALPKAAKGGIAAGVCCVAALAVVLLVSGSGTDGEDSDGADTPETAVRTVVALVTDTPEQTEQPYETSESVEPEETPVDGEAVQPPGIEEPQSGAGTLPPEAEGAEPGGTDSGEPQATEKVQEPTEPPTTQAPETRTPTTTPARTQAPVTAAPAATTAGGADAGSGRTEGEPAGGGEPMQIIESIYTPTPTQAPVQTPEPEPVRTPEPEPVRTPEPEPVRTPEPEPVRTPEPEPVWTPEPEPVWTPEPEPVWTPEPAPVQTPDTSWSNDDYNPAPAPDTSWTNDDINPGYVDTPSDGWGGDDFNPYP